MYKTSRSDANARMGQQCAESNSKNSNINFERGFERDQTYRLALISRNLAELARLNLDLVPIKGPRQTLESKLASGASRANWFVDFNFDIGAALSFVLFLALATYLRHSPSLLSRLFFSLYPAFLRFPAIRRPRPESTTLRKDACNWMVPLY